MSSFSIHCTTCKSRLKVRDESAIGQIVACPKCSSMVMIEAPSEPVVPQPSAADMPDTVGDSQLANSFEEAASWFDEDSPTEPATAESNVDDPTTEQKVAEEPPAEPATATKAAAAATVAAHVTPPTAPPPPAEQSVPETASAPLMPGDAWTSASTASMKRIGLVAGAAVVGIASVVGLAIAVTSGGGNDPTPNQVAERGEDPPETPVEIDPPPVEVPVEQPDPAPVVPEPDPTPTDPVTPEPPIEPVTPPAETEDPPVDVPPAIPEPDVPTDPTPIENPPVETNPDTEPPLFTEQPAVPATPTNSGLAALDALLPYLDGPEPDSDPLANPPPTEPTPPPSETRDPLLEPDPSEVPEPVDESPTKPEPRAVDVAARMADPIEAIEFPATPLVDFFRLMTDFSTIPITLDPTALSQLKITPDDQIAVVMGKTTVGEVLRQAASRKNLKLEIGDDQITVTHNRDTTGSLRQAKYTVTDLVGRTPQELEALRQLMLIHVAPGSWQETGGAGEIEAVPGALLIRHTEPVHHAAVLFIEKLRLARGLALRSNYDPLLFDSVGRVAAFQSKLDQTLSLNYFEPTRLLTVIDRLETIAGVHITVDWPALLAEGWTPDTTARLSVADAPLAEALDKLLAPRELTYEVIASDWIQLTTASAIAKRREVEFHAVAELLERKAWKASDLQAAVLADLPVAVGETRPVLGFDQASNSLIVSASPASQETIRRLLGDL